MLGYGRQDINQADCEAVLKVLQGDYLTCGPAVAAFEERIAALSGAPHAIAVSNGTSALRLLYQIAGVGPGKVVGVPAITFVATASQALMLGAEVVLLDVDPQTLLLTPEIVQGCKHKLDFVVPVHMAGQLCDMPGIHDWAVEHNCVVLEDAAHAFASTRSDGSAAGDARYADGAIFSFHPVKNITCGEGGAIVCHNQQWADALRRLRHHGIQPGNSNEPWMHAFYQPATNERLSDIQAALGLSQCQRIQEFKQRRAAIHQRYETAFINSDIFSVHATQDQDPFWHLCIAHVDWKKLGHNRLWLFEKMKAQGIQLQVHYIPLHHQPMLMNCKRASDLAGADAAYNAVVSLPCFPALTDAEQETVIEALLQF